MLPLQAPEAADVTVTGRYGAGIWSQVGAPGQRSGAAGRPVRYDVIPDAAPLARG